jgi:outer membrane protein assembly factor BamB
MKAGWLRWTCAFGLALFTWLPAFAGEATTYQINPQHSGAAVFQPALKLPLKQVWTRKFGGMTSYPLIAQGTVYVSVANSVSYGSVVHALDEATGATIWSRPVAGTYWTSLIAYDSGRLFVVNFDGVLQALDAATGKQLRRTQLPGQYEFESPPTARDGVVYLNGAGVGVTLYAVLESNGTVLWSQTMVAGNWGSPTLSEDGVFVSFPCQVFEFDILTGVQRWNRNGGCDGGGGVTAALYDQLLFTSEINVNNSSTGYALLAFNGAVHGPLGDLANSNAYVRGVGVSYPPALQGGYGYLVNNTNVLVALEIPSLARRWTFAGDGTISPAAIVVDGTVLAASTAGNFYALDGKTGVPQQTLTLPPSSPQGIGGVPNGLSAGDNIIAVPYNTTLTVFKGS